MNMSSLKKFVGDYAYSYIKNIAVDQDTAIVIVIMKYLIKADVM